MADSFKKARPSVLYFALVFLGYVLTVVIPGFRTGVFAAALLCAVFIETGLDVIKSDSKSDFISLLNVSVCIYFAYNLISVVWVLKNGFPISIFVEEFSNSILPAVLFFAVVCLYRGGAKSADILYKAFLYSFIVLSIVCII